MVSRISATPTHRGRPKARPLTLRNRPHGDTATTVAHQILRGLDTLGTETRSPTVTAEPAAGAGGVEAGFVLSFIARLRSARCYAQQWSP